MTYPSPHEREQEFTPTGIGLQNLIWRPMIFSNALIDLSCPDESEVAAAAAMMLPTRTVDEKRILILS